MSLGHEEGREDVIWNTRGRLILHVNRDTSTILVTLLIAVYIWRVLMV